MMARHLRLYEFADYSPNDFNWLVERLRPYVWALKFEEGQYTCTAWTKDASLTGYQTTVGYSHSNANYAMCGAYDSLVDLLDAPKEGA